MPWRFAGYLLTAVPLSLAVILIGALLGDWNWLALPIVGVTYLPWAISCWRQSTTPAKLFLGMYVIEVATRRPASFRTMVFRQAGSALVFSIVGTIYFELTKPSFLGHHAEEITWLVATLMFASAAGVTGILQVVDGLFVIAKENRRLVDRIVGTQVVDV